MMKLRTAMLITISVLAAIVWRVELELHGWAGLDWIGYFHWAVPAGTVMFIAWLYFAVPLPGRIKRMAFVCTAAVAGVIWYFVVLAALIFHFHGGPGAFVMLMSIGKELFILAWFLVFAVVPLTPLLFAGLLRIFGIRTGAKRLAWAVVTYVMACPISIGILAAVQHQGGADAIHTIKSGVIIPFLIVGLGMLVPATTGRHQAAVAMQNTVRVKDEEE